MRSCSAKRPVALLLGLSGLHAALAPEPCALGAPGPADAEAHLVRPKGTSPPSASSGRARAALRYVLEASLGLEYDSNATRLDSTDGNTALAPVQAGLLRGQLHGAIRVRPCRSLHLRATYDLAGKVFFQHAARGQDTLIHRLFGALALGLSNGFAAQVTGLYHEGFQRASEGSTPGDGLLDFRLLEGRAALLVIPDPHIVLSSGAGIQRLTYKPDPSLSFDGLLAFAALHGSWTLGRSASESELEASLGYSLSRRTYGTPMERQCTSETCRAQCASDPDCDPDLPITFAYPGSRRVDLLNRISVGITWVGPLLLSATYALGVSNSNSLGLGYLRHDATLRCVSELPWHLYLTAQLRLRILSAEIPGGVDARSLGFEEENRSHILLQIDRRVWRGLRAVVRYTLFVGDLARPNTAALRHLAYGGLAFGIPRQ